MTKPHYTPAHGAWCLWLDRRNLLHDAHRGCARRAYDEGVEMWRPEEVGA